MLVVRYYCAFPSYYYIGLHLSLLAEEDSLCLLEETWKDNIKLLFSSCAMLCT